MSGGTALKLFGLALIVFAVASGLRRTYFWAVTPVSWLSTATEKSPVLFAASGAIAAARAWVGSAAGTDVASTDVVALGLAVLVNVLVAAAERALGWASPDTVDAATSPSTPTTTAANPAPATTAASMTSTRWRVHAGPDLRPMRSASGIHLRRS